jgi:hypothetical protein
VRQLLGEDAAERDADDVDAVEPERVQDVHQCPGETGHAARDAVGRRLAGAGSVQRDGLVAQRVDGPFERDRQLEGRADAREHEQGAAGASHGRAHAHAVHVEVTDRHLDVGDGRRLR